MPGQLLLKLSFLNLIKPPSSRGNSIKLTAIFPMSEGWLELLSASSLSWAITPKEPMRSVLPRNYLLTMMARNLNLDLSMLGITSWRSLKTIFLLSESTRTGLKLKSIWISPQKFASKSTWHTLWENLCFLIQLFQNCWKNMRFRPYAWDKNQHLIKRRNSERCILLFKFLNSSAKKIEIKVLRLRVILLWKKEYLRMNTVARRKI